MALIGLRLDATREYRSKFDPERDTENATVFTLGTLSSRVVARIRDKSTEFNLASEMDPDKTMARINGNHSQYETVRFGLKGWKNFLDEAGDEIPFKTKRSGEAEVVAPDCMELLPLALISELSDEISKSNDLKEEEAKNSEGSRSV